MIKGHGGNVRETAELLGCHPAEITDMSSNLNPLGPPPGLVEHLSENLKKIISLPEVDARQCIEVMAAEYGVAPSNVLAGNGTTQFIYTIPKALKTKKALIVGPTYADYGSSCAMHGVDYDYFLTREADWFIPDAEELERKIPGYDTVFLCNPSNPTGVLMPETVIEQLARTFTDTFFIIDESYLPFVPQSDQKSGVYLELSNVLVLNSMSKIFRMPGLRVGFLIAAESAISKFLPYQLPWNVNALAQEAVVFISASKTATQQFLEDSNRFFITEKEVFTRAVTDTTSLALYPSCTFFQLARLPNGITADQAWKFLLKKKILIRNCENFAGLDNQFIRFSLKERTVNLQLAELLQSLCPV